MKFSLSKSITNLKIRLKGKMENIFPEITETVLEEYGEIILHYIEENDVPTSWKNNKILFKYACKYNKELLNKFDIKLYTCFPEITESILEEYGEIILYYIENNEIPNVWNNNKILYKYVCKNNYKLKNKFVINFLDVFSKINENDLLEYKDVILDYLENNKFPYSWNNDKLLFTFIYENKKDLLNKIYFPLDHIFPSLTEEDLLKYGDLIIDYIEKNSSMYNWMTSDILFKHIMNDNHLKKEQKVDLIKKLDLRYLIFGLRMVSINNEPLSIETNTFEKNINDENIAILSNMFAIDFNSLKSKLFILHQRNNEIFNTLNFDILKKDDIDIDLLSKFTLYPTIQEIICSMDNNSYNIFIKISNYLNKLDYDIISVIETIINNINFHKDMLKKISVNDLNEERLVNLIYLLQRDSNIFNIENINDLDNVNFENKKNDYFNRIGSELSYIAIDDIKKAIFEKIYSCDYKMAMLIYKKYFCGIKDLEESGLSKDILNILKAFDFILNKCTSRELLKKIYNNSNRLNADFYTAISLEAGIRKEYAKMYKKTLYQLKDEDKSKNPNLQNVIYDGKKINFFEVDDDFNMQVHSLNAYQPMFYDRTDNYLAQWNQASIKHHGISMCYIGNNQIAIANNYSVILGFSDYEDSALLTGCNSDLNSDIINRNFSIGSEAIGNLLPPKKMIESTRYWHNELVIERINRNSSDHYKRLPDYIVYIVDDINNSKNFSEKNEKYLRALKVASQFNLPVVIIDRTKFINREHQKCEQLEKEFYSTKDATIMKKLYLTYMCNYVGCRSITNKFFNDEQIVAFLSKLFNYLVQEVNNITEKDIKLEEQINTFIDLIAQDIYNFSAPNGPQPPINLETLYNQLIKISNYYKNRLLNFQNNLEEKNVNEESAKRV